MKNNLYKHYINDAPDTGNIPINYDADVLVVGGGISGVFAAISAARNKANTLLIERLGILGGMATSGLIPPISQQFVDISGNLITQGLVEELLDRLASEGGTIKEWKDWKIPKLPFDIEIFKLVIYQMLRESGVKVLLNTTFLSAQIEDSLIANVIIENKSGKQAIKAKVLIDCTGEADLVRACGVPCTLNTKIDSTKTENKHAKKLLKNIGWTQPTEKTTALQFMIGYVDLQKLYDYIIANPESYNCHFRGKLKENLELFKYLWKEKGIIYFTHKVNFKNEIEKAVKNGEFRTKIGKYSLMGECGCSIDGLKSNNLATITANRIRINPFDAEEVTEAMLDGQLACFEIWRFLKKYIPGFENSNIVSVAPLLGVRRTTQIVGNHVYTLEDRESLPEYDDVIGMTSRKIDGINEIPYGCLVPKMIKNLLVGSGKCVSTDDYVMYRTKAHCMVIAQAAGTAAAICANKRWSVQDLDIKALQKILLKQGVYLGDEARLKKIGLM